MAAKRLKEIMEIEKTDIKWDVFRINCAKRRNKDTLFDEFFASLYYSTNTSVGTEKKGFIKNFANNALAASILDRADYIFSRAQPSYSHEAAYKYKDYYPRAKWFAEFSDPLSRNGHGEMKKTKLATYFEDVEQMVYEKADTIIFKNENHMNFMLSYNKNPDMNESIRKRAMILPHPTMDKKYVDIVKSDYKPENGKTNIAFFGAFYANTRTHINILSFLKNENVVLHIFFSGYYGNANENTILEDAKALGYDISRLKINPSVSNFEMLNIASKMDYLYVEEPRFTEIAGINNAIPSKFAEYMTVINATEENPKIIALVDKDSVLSKKEHPRLIKIKTLTDNFLGSLSEASSGKERRAVVV
jgi:hypothetical protein